MEKINGKENVDDSKYMGANLYIKEKPIKEFKNINENIYDNHNNESTKSTNEVQVTEDSGCKKVYLGFPTTKRTIVVFCLLLLTILTIGFLVTPTINYNGVPTDMNLFQKIKILSYFWGCFIAAYYIFIKPFSITFTKNNNGDISVIKQNIFYLKKIYSFKKEQDLSIVGRKGRVFNQGIYFVVFFTPKYKMLLQHKINGETKEIDLSFNMFYRTGSMGRDIGFFSKEQLIAISDNLGLALVIR